MEEGAGTIIGYTFHCGDLFHYGHLYQLRECRKHCDYLIVGILTDSAVETYKRKPIIPYGGRAEVYGALSCVDQVVPQDSRDPTENLKTLRPDLLFHGSDWAEVPGKDYIESIGGRLIKTPYPCPCSYGTSTTEILATVSQRYSLGQLNIPLVEGYDVRTCPSELGRIREIAASVGEAYTRSWPRLNQPWYDHRYDWARGPANWMWMERGIFGMQCVRDGDRVLDLFCGDGMFSGLFFSRLAKQVDGIDRDSEAIGLASRVYSRPNVAFYTLDAVQDDFPSDHYDAVMFFEAIEHLSVEDGNTVLNKVARCLSESGNGTLLGSTPLGGHGNPEHQNVFETVDELQNFLLPHFNHVDCWLSKWNPLRTEVYFRCS